MNKKPLVIHPYLFALYPVVTLLATNLDQISPGIGLRAAIILLSGTTLLMLIFWFWMKDINKAGLTVSSLLFLIFSFKYIILLVGIWGENTYVPVVDFALLIIFLILILISPWLIWRFVKSSLDILTKFLNIMSVVIVILPLIQIGSYLLSSPDKTKTTSQETISINQSHDANISFPDIYYIIVDGYGRADVLQEIYGFDNSDFLNKLTEHRFYVADESTANYMQTHLSLSSSLNYNYLNELMPALDSKTNRRAPLNLLIQQNQVRQTLEAVGYETIIYDSNWPTIATYADKLPMGFEKSPDKVIESLRFNSFESLLWRNTIFKYLTPNSRTYDDHRNLILENFAGLKSAASVERAQFVVGHVIVPHPPFVFDATGQPIQPDYPYSLNDGSHFVDNHEAYLTGYAGQIAHINTLLLDTVSTILAESDQPPIIIIQGDHGPGSTVNFDVVENNTCFKERQAILNAYYFPDGDYDTLYESITPVNSFRVVLNKVVGSDLELVPDKNYFSLWNSPYDFTNITDELANCQIPKN